MIPSARMSSTASRFTAIDCALPMTLSWRPSNQQAWSSVALRRLAARHVKEQWPENPLNKALRGLFSWLCHQIELITALIRQHSTQICIPIWKQYPAIRQWKIPGVSPAACKTLPWPMRAGECESQIRISAWQAAPALLEEGHRLRIGAHLSRHQERQTYVVDFCTLNRLAKLGLAGQQQQNHCALILLAGPVHVV